MAAKPKRLLILFVLFLAFFPAHIVLADVGPKPTMEFEFKQGLSDGQLVITSGILYECEQSDCTDARPLEELGPQRFTCEALNCRAMAYGFSDYHKLEIRFSDGKTRQSNVFKTAGFDSKYTVTVQPGDLLVEAQFSLMAFSSVNFIFILCILMVGAGIIGLTVFFVRRRKK